MIVDDYKDVKFTVSDTRVLTTKWFDNSQERIYQCKDMIIRSFKTCGIVANVDGSVDSQIIIWGLEGYVISGPEEKFQR